MVHFPQKSDHKIHFRDFSQLTMDDPLGFHEQARMAWLGNEQTNKNIIFTEMTPTPRSKKQIQQNNQTEAVKHTYKQ